MTFTLWEQCEGGFGCDCKEKQKALGRRKVIPHGTRAGYRRHLRENTPPCLACREANTKVTKDHRSKSR